MAIYIEALRAWLVYHIAVASSCSIAISTARMAVSGTFFFELNILLNESSVISSR